jgi:hypothetical protein
MGVTGSWTGAAVFLGLSPMAVAMLNFFEGEGLLPWEQGSCLLFFKSIRKGVWRRGDTYSEEDFEERTEERDHHGREEEGAGTIDMDREGVNK